MLILFLVGFIFSETIDDLIIKVYQESPLLKEIATRTASFDESYKTVYGKYDFQFYSDLNYTDQDGGITGNFFMQNSKYTNFEFGLRKNFDYGISAELNHSLNRTEISSDIIGQKNIYIPVVNASLKMDLLENFMGKLDSIVLDNVVLQSEKNFINQKITVEKYLLNVLANFLKTKAIKDQLEVAIILLSSTNDLLKVVKRKFKIGSAEKRNLLYAETNYQSSQETLISTKRQYTNSLYSLNSICGFDVSNFLELTINELYLQSTYENLSKSGINNLELESLKIETKLLKNDLTIRKNYLLPSLSMAGSYSFGGADETFSAAYDTFPNKGYFIGLNLIWDIHNTSAKHFQKSTELSLEAIGFNYKYLEYALDKDLKALKESINSYYEQKAITDVKYQNCVKRLDLELKAFELGRSSMTEVIDAQRALALSYAEKNNLRYELLISIYTTAYKKGVLTEIFNRGIK